MKTTSETWLKGTAKGKMKGGIGWKLRISGVEQYIIRHLSDVPVSRNWYKTVSKLYENLYIWNFV